MRNKNIIILLIMIIFLVFISFSKDTIASFLVASRMKDDKVTIGDVKVIARLFYEKEGVLYPAREINLNGNDTKKGVYFVNVSDTSALEYIDNLCIKIYVYSDVETYVRVKLFEELSIVKDTPFGKIEYSMPMTEDINYHYDSNWILYDDFYYYPQKLIRQSKQIPTEISFIVPQENLITPYDDDYFLQVGVRLESVQALLGPQKNWGLEEAPWGGEW
ncbi:MAG TPA: hypothetical protein VIK94_03245 [Bacilli bacterium]